MIIFLCRSTGSIPDKYQSLLRENQIYTKKKYQYLYIWISQYIAKKNIVLLYNKAAEILFNLLSIYLTFISILLYKPLQVKVYLSMIYTFYVTYLRIKSTLTLWIPHHTSKSKMKYIENSEKPNHEYCQNTTLSVEKYIKLFFIFSLHYILLKFNQ